MDWLDEAACRGLDTEIFFTKPVKKEAVQTCEQCPVSEQCYQYALVHENFGYFGGSTDKERYSARIRLGIPHPEFIDKNMTRVLRNRGTTELTYEDIVHGTEKGYNQEKKGGWPPCERCLVAHREYIRAYRARQKESA